jgi:hypothetical protein
MRIRRGSVSAGAIAGLADTVPDEVLGAPTPAEVFAAIDEAMPIDLDHVRANEERLMLKSQPSDEDAV